MLVVVALIISTKEKLGFTKDIIISVIRAVIQLVAVGYLLKYVFQVNNLILTLIMVLVIVSNAAFNAKRSQQLQKGFWFLSLQLVVVQELPLVFWFFWFY